MSNIKLIVRSMAFILLAALLLAQAFPQVFFSNKIKSQNITIFSDNNIPKEISLEITKAINLLKQSPFYNENEMYEIFVANRGYIYYLLGPDFTSGSFARTNLFNNIVIRSCNKAFETCYSKSTKYNERSLNGLIAHEITHINIRAKLGYIRECLTPSWKKEGISDYISQSSSYSGVGNYDTKAYEYYLYRLVSSYAIEKKGIEISKFLELDMDFEKLKTEFNQSLQQN